MEILRLFVSATRDLEEERAVIAQALAELPVKVGAEIRRTPVGGLKYDDLYETIANVDRVYFLMGRDITAPAGAEWDLAWKLERRILPLRTPGPRSPAGERFLRFLPMGWITFRNRAELSHVILLDLVELLLHPENRYGLTMVEQERLLRLHRRLGEQRAAASASSGKKEETILGAAEGGMAGGGVLLDDGRRKREDVGDGLLGAE